MKKLLIHKYLVLARPKKGEVHTIGFETLRQAKLFKADCDAHGVESEIYVKPKKGA